jgi:hypothetical protein
MKKIMSIMILFIGVAGFIISCSKQQGQPGTDPGNPPANNCDVVNAKFATGILPIIQSQCAIGSGCHGNGSRNGPGELLSFIQIKNAATNIKSAVVTRLMPQGSSLSSAQISQIACWVDNGALNN